MLGKIIIKFVLLLIYLYQMFLSPMKTILFGANCACRFYPSCSEYGRLAFKQYGFFKGFYLTFMRFFRCHPFHSGGYDPVPSAFHFKASNSLKSKQL